MNPIRIFTFIVVTIFLIGCSNSEKQTTTIANDPAEMSPLELAEGFQLTENNCFSCHSPNASIENRVAPPMEAIKKHYIDSQTNQAEFTADLIAFLNNPSEDLSKMPGAIRRFGVMPKMNFSDEQIAKIAAYIYNSELEKPDWFEDHYQAERKKYGASVQSTPIETGQTIAMKTKGVLGSNLLQAINTKGTEGAVSFCSTKAIPLTDSMSVALNAQVRRVSDKNRNPDNKANEAELAYIMSAKSAIAQGEKPQAQLITEGNKMLGYYPIITGQMCLQCHGEPETEILPNTLAKIQTLYPEDMAVGYNIDELRGIWVVEMDKQ
jgi:mono/diheme cytochrome c family protein